MKKRSNNKVSKWRARAACVIFYVEVLMLHKLSNGVSPYKMFEIRGFLDCNAKFTLYSISIVKDFSILKNILILI